jgi:hypothetical protein
MRKGLLFALLLIASASRAQDSLRVVNDSVSTTGADTVLLKSYATRYDPRKALLYAAVLPGAGQIYNKKYWKLPLVYGGFIGFGYGINFYQQLYTRYKRELFFNLENGYPNDTDIRDNDIFTTSAYRRAVDQSKRQRDFMLILMAGMYLLQIVDAHVDAHLKEFDLNPSLQVSVRPTMEQTAMLGNQTGFTVVIRF